MSPIRPENRARYPKNWKEVSDRIRARSGGRCECKGECGLHPPKKITPSDAIDNEYIEYPRRCIEEHGKPALFAKGKVILTVAHLDHTPENCGESNLKAMCQRCHLRYDMGHHANTRRKNRDQKTGQLSLLGEKS